MSTGPEPRSILRRDEAPEAAGQLSPPSLETRLLRRLLTGLGDPPIEFQLGWSGERVAPSTTRATDRVRIADRATLRGLLRDPNHNFGDAYSTGQIEVEGVLVRLVSTVF